MSDYDGSSFVWFLAGLAVGGLVGVLYAPRPGSETREEIKARAEQGREYVRSRAREAREQASGWVDKGRDVVRFATFGAGFLVRPLGAIVIGHFGDRVGRKPMLVLTLTVTGVCTALIGVLPTFASVGVLAPALLVVLRLLQGFFLGGEQSGAAVLVVGQAASQRRTFVFSYVSTIFFEFSFDEEVLLLYLIHNMLHCSSKFSCL